MSGQLRALIIEDRDSDLALMLHELKKSGFTLDHRVVTREEDFARELKQPVDIILADYSVPQFGAAPALQHLRERNIDVPLIVVTGSLGDEAAVECIKLGANDYVLKDRMGRLGPAIQRAIEDHRLRHEKRLAERAVQESENRYRRLVEWSPEAIFIVQDGNIVYANPAGVSLFGGKRPEEIINTSAIGWVHPDYTDRVRGRTERVLATQQSVPLAEQKLILLNGKVITVEAAATFSLFEGRPAIQVVMRDVTERYATQAALAESEEHYRRLAESNRRLLQEVNHRVRNNLASLRSLISLTRNKVVDVPSFATALENRVMTLSQIHNLLAESGWRDLDLRTLVTSLLSSMQRTAPNLIPVEVEGSPVRISPRQSLPLAMSLLELFTNSCKHGAHTAPTGRLNIEWKAIDTPDGKLIRLSWREAGGPTITGRVSRSLGTELIEGFVSFELGGKCELNFTPEGVRHVIEFPAAVFEPTRDATPLPTG